MTNEQFNKLPEELQAEIRVRWRDQFSGVSMVSRTPFETWLEDQSVFEWTNNHLLIRAFKQVSFPGNPRPFLKALEQGIFDHGTDWIKSDEAKALLWVLMSQSYGQLAVIDLSNEWERLNGIIK